MLWQWGWLLALATAFVAAACTGSWFWRADLALYDAAVPAGRASPDVIIVGVDEASLRALGRWPWHRSVHAALLARLRDAGAAAVALDFLFTEPEADTQAGDQALAAAMLAGPPVVLPIAPEPSAVPGVLRESLPTPVLRDAAAALGHAEVELDGDGIVRSVFLRAGAGQPELNHLAVALLQAAPDAPAVRLRGVRNPDPGRATSAWVRDYQLYIPFDGPPGSIPHVSYAEVLDGRVPGELLRGKIVLVGATAQGLGDAYPTPGSAYGVAMPGVEITANVASALRGGLTIRRLAPWLSALLCTAPVLATFIGFLFLSPRRSLLLVILLIAATLALTVALLRVGGLWWPSASALAALVMLYPLWSWRRLEAAQAFLEAEFESFSHEQLPLIGSAAAQLRPGHRLDVVQHRIDLVRQATQRLRDVRRLFTDTVQSLPDATLVVDVQGRIVLANPAATALLGARDAAGIEGRPLDGEVFRELSGTQLDFAQVAARAPCTFESRPERLGRDLLLRVVPFAADNGTRLGTLLDLADITDLRQAQRERDEVMSFLSHDMKSPATSLAGLAELQRDPARALPPRELSERLDLLAKRTLSLVDGFLALTRAEAADPLVFVSFELHDAVQDAVDEVWASARARSVSIAWQAPPAAALVLGDRYLLARAVMNLLVNAVRYSAPMSHVGVTLELAAGEGRVVVRDEGPGIIAERRAELFTRFARGLHVGPNDPGGAGLGLAFVRTVALKHGGRVVVDSEEGRGSTFTLVVPLAGADETVSGA